jgi:hypothetical protein
VQAVETTLGARVCRRVATELAELAVTLLLYADDLLIVSRTLEGAQRLLDACVEFCARYGLAVHPGKSKVLPIGAPLGPPVTLAGRALPVVGAVRYLGLTLEATGALLDR